MFRILTGLTGIALAACSTVAVPAQAETLEELDLLSDATADEESGIQLARDQAGSGELLEALATIERVLVEHPKSAAARLLQAFYLCRVDDRVGGSVALSKLKERDYAQEALDQVRATCSVPTGEEG